ncbi:MAG TPA: tRNA (adenosine(37)-N6)-threonylcarbamoyltransferase complex dimerization subunit type 1 TsaB [Verrucomicrobiae bacterium]|nr:tRNA (adenosine(37)-N6)-threonylcarbamoyltransferase complex dimerization subunit type 1 TsaB [Verrucomicrobiae bacterium]
MTAPAPLILAIDTTHESGSLALLRGAGTLEETALRAPTGFAHVLYGELAALLDRNAVPLSSIDCFAAASGPGSFTGVRVGLACVKGLAEAAKKPAVAISNLRALATFGQSKLRAPLIDARRGEVYAAVYDAAGGVVVDEMVVPLEVFLQRLPAGEVEFIGSDFSPFQPAVAGTLAPAALAAAIGRLAHLEFAAGRASDPAALDANYVRRSDAELFWKD